MAEQATKRRRPRLAVALNLASDPIGGKRVFATAAGLAGLVLLGVAGSFGWILAGTEPDEFTERQRILEEQRQAVASLAKDARSKISGEGAARVRERTELLNGLLVRKGVSWTKTFLDLETVLPPAVRMLTIQPEVAGQDTLRLDMTVSARAAGDFIEFLRALETSRVFQHPVLRGSAPPSEGDPTFRYRLTVDYDQQL